jgi:hypothetical protein
MKVLITVSSWVGAATNGENQAMRETFLKDAPAYPGLEYRFFIGDGLPTGDDETALFASFDASAPGYRNKAIAGMRTAQTTYIPKEDEVILPNTPDDYARLCYKVRGQFRWALEHGFDYTFQVGSDIYIVLKRLMESGFEAHDYVGKTCGVHPLVGNHYAGGGGYWLSKKALQHVVDQPVTFWAEDLWVGSIMSKNNIGLHIDPRYAVDYPELPHRDNDIITSHLGIHNGVFGKYDPKIMYEVHAAFERENL